MSTLEFAIQMEVEGQRYYKEQAKKNKDSEISRAFLLLAEAEKEHEQLLTKSLNKEEYILKSDNSLTNIKTVFQGLKDYKTDDYDSSIQLDVYRLAVEIEEKSVELYKELLENADNDKDKLLFEFLLKEENEHIILFDELVKLVNRPKEWVESPEFGLREDY